MSSLCALGHSIVSDTICDLTDYAAIVIRRVYRHSHYETQFWAFGAKGTRGQEEGPQVIEYAISLAAAVGSPKFQMP
jgi:hypothetical protein